jgi:hypothetical protein
MTFSDTATIGFERSLLDGFRPVSRIEYNTYRFPHQNMGGEGNISISITTTTPYRLLILQTLNVTYCTMPEKDRFASGLSPSQPGYGLVATSSVAARLFRAVTLILIGRGAGAGPGQVLGGLRRVVAKCALLFQGHRAHLLFEMFEIMRGDLSYTLISCSHR